MPVTAELDELFVAAVNAGAKKIMLPEDSRNDYEKLKTDLKNELKRTLETKKAVFKKSLAGRYSISHKSHAKNTVKI